MNRLPVNSSHLASVGYDPTSSTLEVEFNGGDVYQYFDVPAEIYRQLLALSDQGSGVGHYFDQNFKKAGYRFLKL